MPEPKPSNDFLLFQPSFTQERLYVPSVVALFIGYYLYNQVGLSYALFLSPFAYWLATGAVLVASSTLTLLALNVYWAYEGNLTRQQKRPQKAFNDGSKKWCIYRHCLVFLMCVATLRIYFHEAIPHALLHYTGKPATHELLVEEKKNSYNKFRRSCSSLVAAHSLEYRSDKLCLESDKFYAEVNVGDVLIVEGKANWIGLLVDKPIALRDGESGNERSLRSVPR